MLIHTAHLKCRPDIVEAFRDRLLRHARTTLECEPGCRRFDVHQEMRDPTLFFLFEVYDDESALETHRDSDHHRAFRADTVDWVTSRTWWFWSTLS